MTGRKPPDWLIEQRRAELQEAREAALERRERDHARAQRLDQEAREQTRYGAPPPLALNAHPKQQRWLAHKVAESGVRPTRIRRGLQSRW